MRQTEEKEQSSPLSADRGSPGVEFRCSVHVGVGAEGEASTKAPLVATAQLDSSSAWV